MTRNIQNSSEIECFAFKPNISVVGENKDIFESVPNSDNDKELAERHKWLKAYAVQQMNVDELIEQSSIFQNARGKYDCEINFLCVGYDHIHLHINTTPDYSIDEVINYVLEHLNSGIRNAFPGLFDNKKVIFEKSYFGETIG